VIVKPTTGSFFAQSRLNDAQVHQSDNIEPVLLIHGTFANKQSDGPVDWWQPGSDFCHDVDALLQKEGATARCWANLRSLGAESADGHGGHRTRPFAWTGENSELARRTAGSALAAELAVLERDHHVKRYHLIGHSHGGNVILQALRALSGEPTKLGAVVFMGTPVLSFRHREALDTRWIAIPLYIAALIGSVLGYRDAGDNQIIWGTVGVAIFLATLAEIFRSNSGAQRSDLELYGGGYPIAFVFDGDEAITSLVSAQRITRDPRSFIDQFAQSTPSPPFAFPPTSAPEQSLAARIQNTGVYALLRSLSHPTVPTLNYVPGVRGVAGVASRIDDPRTTAADRWQIVASWIDAASTGFPFKAIMIGVLWACAALPMLIMLTMAAMYIVATRAATTIAGFVVLGFAKMLGRIALPVLVRKAAFGADLGHFLEVRSLPPGVAHREIISDALREEAAAISHRFGQDAGHAIVNAVASMDAFAIKSQVNDALTNTALAHSHYYKAANIKERIARMIATRPAKQWPATLPSWLESFRPIAWVTEGRDAKAVSTCAKDQDLQPPSEQSRCPRE
jgi:hypothetical protein